MPKERPTLSKSMMDRAKFASLGLSSQYFGSNTIAEVTITPTKPDKIIVPTFIRAQSQWRGGRSLLTAAKNALLADIDERQLIITRVLDDVEVSPTLTPLMHASEFDRVFQQPLEVSSITDEVDLAGFSLRVRFDAKNVDEFQYILINYKEIYSESEREYQ